MFLKMIQTLDKIEWIDNSNYIAKQWMNIFRISNENNFIKLIDEDKDFCENFFKFFTLIHEKFRLNEKSDFLYPSYFLFYLMETMMKSYTFKYFCTENNFMDYIIKNYLNNINFPNECFLNNEEYFNYGLLFNFNKNEIYEMFLYCVEILLLQKDNYENLQFLENINQKINYLIKLNNFDLHVFILRFLIINICYFNHRNVHELKIDKSIFQYIFSFIHHYLNSSNDQQIQMNYEINMTIAFFRNFFYLNPNLHESIDNEKSVFLDLFKNCSQEKHAFIIECILYIFYSNNYSIDNQLFANKFKRIILRVEEKNQCNLGKIIHKANEKICSRFKSFIFLRKEIANSTDFKKRK